MTLSIVLVGGGVIGREHLARIQASLRCKVVALVTLAATLAIQQAAQRGARVDVAQHA